MLEHIKAVLFDLDGTLVDSMWVWNDIDVEYLGRFGLSLPETLQKEIEGMSFTETAVYIKQKFSIPDPIEKMKEDWNAMAFDKYVNEVPLKKGVPEFLALCRKKGICPWYPGRQKCRYEGMCRGRCLFGLSGKRKA